METLTPGNEPAQQPEQQQSMLEDVLDTSAYDAQVKKAQNAIYIVAGLQLVWGLITAFIGSEEERNINIGVAVVISAIFGGIGLWCKYKPFAAIITALSLYGSLLLLDAFFDPTTIVKGILLKIFVIGALIRGISAAKAARDIKNIGK